MAKRFGKSTVAAVTGPRSKQARSNKYQLTIAKLSLAKEESSLGLPGRRCAEWPQILLDPSRPSVRRASRKRDCASGPALYERPACENSRLSLRAVRQGLDDIRIGKIEGMAARKSSWASFPV